MDEQYRFCPAGNGTLHQVGIHGPSVWVDVDEDWRRAAIYNRSHRRNERHRHRNNLIPRAYAGGEQRYVKSRRSSINSDTKFYTAVVRKSLLESCHGRTEGKLRAVDHLRYRRIDFRLDLPILRVQIEQWDYVNGL